MPGPSGTSGNPPPYPRPQDISSSLFTQIFALVLATVAVAQVVSLALLVLLPPDPPRTLTISSLAEAVLRRDAELLEFRQVPAAIAGADAATPAIRRLQEPLALALGRANEDVRLRLAAVEARRYVEIYRTDRPDVAEPAIPAQFQLAIRQSHGGWLLIEPRNHSPFDTRERRFLFLFLATAFAMLPIAWLFARRLARPFEQFADAATAIGSDPEAAPPEIRGPMEVERAAEAVSRMQQRLRTYVADRTQMLGAIAHDLRTPLMRLAFRAENLPADDRAPIAADVAEMEAIMQATLDFASAQSRAGAHQRLELASLVEKLVDDLAATGQPVSVVAQGMAVVQADPVQLRRLLDNLIRNAIAYGHQARVRVGRAGEFACVDIEDDGPGIPDAELERVFDPFYRLEGSRSRETGGTGLGLAVVRLIARAHGGEVELHNREGGGLRARLLLPLTGNGEAA